ncbi:MAG: type II and III secretion system protein family protein [Gammaproteobacteria bacterium]|nr:type II and III secretion system protein family protein [Gammaproteobacteria bacterium]
MNKYFKIPLGACSIGLFSLFMLLPVTAGAQSSFTLGLNGGTTVEELTLPVGKSQIIQSDQPLMQVVVGNPNVADVQVLNENQFLVVGKEPGITNLAFRDTDSRIIAVLDLVVGYDLVAIKRKLDEILPDEQQIEVRSANGQVILSGQVSSAMALDAVLAITDSFTEGEVVNLLQVGGGQQVMLEARIAEVNRSRLRDLGVETSIVETGTGGTGSETSFGLLTGDPSRAGFGPGLVLSNLSLSDSLLLNLRALEQEGSAHILAEPNIVALSGQEASFLVGGEFPVPVAQTGGNLSGAITIEFKEFGIGLKFTPTVLSNKRINLRLSTEVSDIDLTSGTTVLGTTVPGLRTRRVATTIELGDGNSFAIAGLLQNDIVSVVRQFPGLGNIPILGALFRSTQFDREETELVIVITPRLVKSTDRNSIALPTDDYRPPDVWDLFFQGKVEAPEEEQTGNQTGVEEQGLDGAQGHQF